MAAHTSSSPSRKTPFHSSGRTTVLIAGLCSTVLLLLAAGSKVKLADQLQQLEIPPAWLAPAVPSEGLTA